MKFVLLFSSALLAGAVDQTSQTYHLPDTWTTVKSSQTTIAKMASDVVSVKNELNSLQQTATQASRHFNEKREYWNAHLALMQKELHELEAKAARKKAIQDQIVRTHTETQHVGSLIEEEQRLEAFEGIGMGQKAGIMNAALLKLKGGIKSYGDFLQNDEKTAKKALSNLDAKLKTAGDGQTTVSEASKTLKRLQSKNALQLQQAMAKVQDRLDAVNEDEMKMQKAAALNERAQGVVAEEEEEATRALASMLTKKRQLADKENLCTHMQAILKDNIKSAEDAILKATKEKNACENFDATENAKLQERLKPFWE